MNKAKNPAGFQPRVAPAQPLTEEQKKMKIAQFLQQKRETIAVNVLCNLVHGAIMRKKEIPTEHLVKMADVAVMMADEMIEKLYPLPEEEQQK